MYTDWLSDHERFVLGELEHDKERLVRQHRTDLELNYREDS